VNDAKIADALAVLEGKGIRATAGFCGEVLVVNVHETALDAPRTWAAVFTEFLKIRYCVKVNPPTSCG
jgi:hypothetical protein